MKKALARLEQSLRERRGAYLARFGDGIDDTMLAGLPPTAIAAMHPDLVEFYRWRNGHPRDLEEGCFQNCAAFLPLADACRAYVELCDLATQGIFDHSPNWWSASWFPLLHGPSGDLLCVDSRGTFAGRPGQLIDFVCNDDARAIVAPDLASWIQEYCDMLSDDALDDMGCLVGADEFQWTRNLAGFPAIHSASEA